MLRSPPMTPVSGLTSLATMRSQPLALSLSLRVLDHILGFGGEADDECLGACAWRVAMVLRMSGIFHELELGRPARAPS